MKVSIITVTFNSVLYLEKSILSVVNQTYKNFELIIIDGGSTDGTLQIIDKYSKYISHCTSEKDQGIYDAMNKGIKKATGDIIGFLNSDDELYDENVLKIITSSFNHNVKCVFGDIVFVDNENTKKILRYYSSKKFSLNQFSYGHMPPHPSFYALRILYDEIGYFKLGYKIAADFDFLIRALSDTSTNYQYINSIIVRMRTGGVSSRIKNKILLNKEIHRSCKENNIKTSYLKIYIKYLYKIFSFIKLKT